MAKDKKLEQLDVDVRFLLANERTLLAWVRTSLTIEAGGVALATVHRHHMLIGLLVMAMGATVTLIGYQRYKAADKSIRNHHLPPVGKGPVVQVYTVVAIAIVLAVAQITVLR